LGSQGNTSFTLNHKIFNGNDIPAGEGKTVHVCVRKKDFKKIPVPDEIKNILSLL